jgi:hypothetical protein
MTLSATICGGSTETNTKHNVDLGFVAYHPIQKLADQIMFHLLVLFVFAINFFAASIVVVAAFFLRRSERTCDDNVIVKTMTLGFLSFLVASIFGYYVKSITICFGSLTSIRKFHDEVKTKFECNSKPR